MGRSSFQLMALCDPAIFTVAAGRPEIDQMRPFGRAPGRVFCYRVRSALFFPRFKRNLTVRWIFLGYLVAYSMNFGKHPLAIAVISIGLGVFGSLVVGNLLPERSELQGPLPHHLAAGDDQFKTSMGALFGSNNVPGNKVETLVNGDKISLDAAGHP